MGKSHETFSKKEKEKKKRKKREEKLKKKEARKENSEGGGLDSMMAYVDAEGNIVDTPPDPSEKEEIDAEDIIIGIPSKEEGDEDPVKTGKVVFFNEDKGYGFIRETETDEKYYVHVTGMEVDTLSENDKVSFELEKGFKGLNCVKVKKI